MPARGGSRAFGPEDEAFRPSVGDVAREAVHGEVLESAATLVGQGLRDKIRGVDQPMVLATLMLFASVAGLAAVYVASGYYQQGSFDHLLSFSAADPPGPMWPEMYPDPFGVHFFGDFLLPLRQGELWAPFHTPGIFVAVYPLFANVVIAPFDLLPYTLATILFLTISVVVLLVPLYVLLDGRKVTERLLLVGPLLLTHPLIHTIDRGNLQGLVVGAALFGMVAYLRSNYGVAGVWFGIAAAMKGYPILLLLLLVRERAWKGLWLGLGTGALATVVTAFAFEGGVVHNLRSFWRASSMFRDPGIHDLIRWNQSFKGLFASVTVLGPSVLNGMAQWMMDQYGLVLFCCGTVLMLSAVVRSTSLLSATTYICVVAAMGMDLSRGYNPLMFLLVIAVVFADSAERDLTTLAVLGLLAVFLAPKGVALGEQRIALSTIANPLLASAMVLLLGIRDIRSGLDRWRARHLAVEISDSADESGEASVSA